MGITVVGSLNYDLVTYTNHVPGAGETFKANSFETHTGGKGLNQTIAISKLKKSDYKVRIVGNIGDDAFGKQLVSYLRENNVDVTRVGVHPEVSTGVATILVEQENGGQNRILITAGANSKTVYEPKELESIFSDKESDSKNIVVFQHEIPDPISVMRWIRENKRDYQIVYNPSPFQPLDKEDWSLVDVLVVNEIESLQIMENVYPQEAVAAIKKSIEKDFVKAYYSICEELQNNVLDQSRETIVIITLGSKGVLFSSKANPVVQYLPAINVKKVVDTTGAGDTFLGGVVTQLYQGATLADAIEFSTSASFLTIQREGAAESIPNYIEVISISNK